MIVFFTRIKIDIDEKETLLKSYPSKRIENDSKTDLYWTEMSYISLKLTCLKLKLSYTGLNEVKWDNNLIIWALNLAFWNLNQSMWT